MTRRISRSLAAVFLTGASTLTVHSLQAAGYAIAEQSIAGLGQGFAGAAAIAEDASTIWHNPAGMSFLGADAQIAGGLNFILPTADFNNTGTVSYLPTSATTGVWVPTKGDDDTSDSPAVVPNLAYSQPINDQVTLGFSVNAPFGLRTSYKEGWIGRYVALETDLKTVNFNPSIAVKINDQVSIGGGISYMMADAVLSNAIDFGLVALGNVPAAALGAAAADIAGNRGTTKYDGGLRLTGDDAAFGGNIGLIFSPAKGTRLGVHYRSEVSLELSGNADFTVPAAFEPYLGALFADQGGKVELTLPSSLSLSIYHEVTERLALLGDVTWTDWSVFGELFVKYDGSLSGSSVEKAIPEKWDDTMRYSVGARYILNEQIALRAGVVMDGAAVQNPEYRSPRIPDADRMWLTGGIHWELGEGFTMDLSYAHVFVDDAKTNNDKHTSGLVLVGDNAASVDILSVGGSFRF